MKFDRRVASIRVWQELNRVRQAEGRPACTLEAFDRQMEKMLAWDILRWTRNDGGLHLIQIRYHTYHERAWMSPCTDCSLSKHSIVHEMEQLP